MPFFDDNPLDRLAVRADDAQSTLDLRGLPDDQAMQRVEQRIKSMQPGETCFVQFDPASNDGRETLFLPLGRRLLEARRAGTLSRCLPAPDGAGYFIAVSD